MAKQKRQLGIGIIIAAFLSLITSCQLGRFVFYNFADINDHKKLIKHWFSASIPKFRDAENRLLLVAAN